MEDVICSRCKQSYRAIYEYQGDNCCCFVSIEYGPNPAPPPPPDELPYFWSSVMMGAHEKSHLAAGYGSRHDMTTFAFIDSETGILLDRYEIMNRYDWVGKDTNVCDDCIDILVAEGRVKVEYDFDMGDSMDSSE